MAESSIPKFFEKNLKERLSIVGEFANLTNEEIKILESATGGIDFSQADKMIENAIGTFSLPIGIATNFRINEKDYLIPMVIEEPSVIAASSKAAKIARVNGGFTATADGNFSIGQIQVVNVDVQETIPKIIASSSEIIELANSKSETLSKLGKGVKEIICKEVKTDSNSMLIVELIIDVGDAMGANVTNTMCEAVAPLIEKLSSGRTLLRILSNYSIKRMVTASAVFDKDNVGGEKVVDDMISAFQFANNDTFRAVTHNKGVMNGTISVANATGQDSRAIEAAAHAYAAKSGMYRSLTEWTKDDSGNLLGKFELPLSVGIVGGVINDHPIAKISKKILGVNSAQELACIMASVGLAQNFAAMRALVTEGIQKGHMKLHARKQD
ncbi:hydroxymethylglutaryl-CoA reductase, degradative [Candidatus Nitrosopelagicus sp.]|nr:hydroxymethylglutaryl-CoA reductase, degradative [Candidatus Nitrosopelagicus sp.]